MRTRTVRALNTPVTMSLPASRTPPKTPAQQVAVGDALVDLLLDALDEVVAVVDVLHPRVGQEVVEHPGCVRRELAALLDDRWDDDPPDEREDREDAEEDDRHGPAPAQVAPGQGLDERVERERQEEGDDEQRDDGAQTADGLDDGVCREHADRADEADVEGRLPVEGRAAGAEVAALVLARPALVGAGGAGLGLPRVRRRRRGSALARRSRGERQGARRRSDSVPVSDSGWGASSPEAAGASYSAREAGPPKPRSRARNSSIRARWARR